MSKTLYTPINIASHNNTRPPRGSVPTFPNFFRSTSSTIFLRLGSVFRFPTITNLSAARYSNELSTDNTLVILESAHPPNASVAPRSNGIDGTARDGDRGFTLFLKGITPAVHFSSTIAEIRTLITQRYPALALIPFFLHFDSFSPRPLSDDHTLSAVGIEPTCTLRLRFAVRGGSSGDVLQGLHSDSTPPPPALSLKDCLGRPISIFPPDFFKHQSPGSMLASDTPVRFTGGDDHMRDIPAPARMLCDPAPSLSVPTFMRLTCPLFSPALSSNDPALADTDDISLPVFSSLDPNTPLPFTASNSNPTLEIISHLCMRSREFCTTLSSEHAQQHSRSILIPHIDPYARLPPWIARFVAALNALSTKRAHWRGAMEWLDRLDNLGSLPILVSQLRSRLNALDWNALLPGFSHWVALSTLNCALLLGNSWITNELIDACGEFLTSRQSPASRSLVINTHIIEILQGVKDTTLYYNNPPHLTDLDAIVSSRTVSKLYIPIHTPGHWSLLCVNLDDREYWYVDPISLRSLLPERQFACVEWWLRAISPGLFLIRTTPPFSPPLQTDTYSCGIIVMSMMAHCILGLPLWTAEIQDVQRAAWFLRLTDSYCCENDEIRGALMADADTSPLSTLPSPAFNSGAKRPPSTDDYDVPNKRRASGSSARSDDSTSTSTSTSDSLVLYRSVYAPLSVACGGLTARVEPLVRAYLARVTYEGGGAPSLLRLAEENFGKIWHDLTDAEKQAVRRYEATKLKWINDHRTNAIFSITCSKTIPFRDAQFVVDPQAILFLEVCSPCKGLLELPAFRRAIRLPPSPASSLQFVPMHGFKTLAQILAQNSQVRHLLQMEDGAAPLVDFFRAVAAGEFCNKQVCLAFFEALAAIRLQQTHDQHRDISVYSPPITDFLDNLAAVSPRLYKEFGYRFSGGISARQLQSCCSVPSSFAPGICSANFRAAADIVQQLQYTGPLSLICDQTPLQPGLRAYLSPENVWVVFGAVEWPLFVETAQELEELLQSGLLVADQLRVWYLNIPLPGTPPIPLASEAATTATLALDLRDQQEMVLESLHEHNIFPCSHPIQGTLTERKVHNHIGTSVAWSKRHFVRSSSHATSILLSAPIFGEVPMGLTQDPDHAMKVARSQFLHCSRLLAIGNHCIHPSQIAELALHPGSPLMPQDAVDRQDEYAPARLFSTATLHFVAEHFPARQALIAILRVLGGLFDAWKDCRLTHLERATLAFRARAFLEGWRADVAQHQYHTTAVHFISPSAYNTLLKLCDGLIMLILIYRDHFPSYPLLPWLHSTAPCERVFALLRAHKRAFNHVDFLLLMPKVMASMDEAYGFRTSQERDGAGPNLRQFKIWPTDLQIDEAYDAAITDANSILAALGVRKQPINTTLSLSFSLTSPNVFATVDRVPRLLLEENLAGMETVDSLICRALQQREQRALSDTHTDDLLDVHVLALVAEMTKSSRALTSLPVTSDSVLARLRDEISGIVSQSPDPANAPEDEEAAWIHHFDSLRHPKPFAFINDISPSELNDVATGMSLLLDGDGGAPDTDIPPAVIPQCAHHGAGFARARRQAFASLSDIHPAIPTANITPALPVRPGSLILSLHDERLVLGNVVTIYASTGMRNQRHELYNNATSLGAASTFCVSTIVPFCRPCTARARLEERVLRRMFLRIPKTHVLFHYPVDLITDEEFVDADTGRPVFLSRLHDSIVASIAAWQARIDEVKLAVAELRRSIQH